MDTTTKYPTINLFGSQQWQERVSALSLLDGSKYTTGMMRGIKVAYLRSGLWYDFEEWPDAKMAGEAFSGSDSADWVIHRKLLIEQTSPEELERFRRSFSLLKRPLIIPYTNSPYIDLEKPAAPKKEAIAHVHRTERKLTREVGAPVLREFNTLEERTLWFDWYSNFQRAQNRMSDEQFEILRKWTTSGEKPEWMWLMALVANDTPLAVGLFYFWDGVFYYFGSAMNPDPKFRKYGPGKLFVELLIRRTCERQGKVFDFLQGVHDYKGHWNPQSRIIYQCIMPRSLKGFLALMLFRLKRCFKSKKEFETHLAWKESKSDGTA